MDRRDFTEAMAAGAATANLLGCSGKGSLVEKDHMDITLPDFSEENLHNQLDNLVVACEAKGARLKGSLLPGVPEDQLKEKCSWFPADLPPEIVSLYRWSGGQERDAWEEEENPFLFRDNSFCSIRRAALEYNSMMQSCGALPEGEMLKFCFPIASFNGALTIIPAKGHILDSVLEKPVISLFEGIDVHFYSVEKMVETCVGWVRHKDYSLYASLPDHIELKIWRKHNPGIFQG